VGSAHGPKGGAGTSGIADTRAGRDVSSIGAKRIGVSAIAHDAETKAGQRAGQRARVARAVFGETGNLQLEQLGVNEGSRRRANLSVRPSMHAYTAHTTISGRNER